MEAIEKKGEKRKERREPDAGSVAAAQVGAVGAERLQQQRMIPGRSFSFLFSSCFFFCYWPVMTTGGYDRRRRCWPMMLSSLEDEDVAGGEGAGR